jgi:cobalt-precorrin 5A hydrolase
MERHAMIVAGFGFRREASLDALSDALAQAGGAEGVTHLATLASKAPGLERLGGALGLPVIAVPAEALRGVATATRSERVEAMFDTGSVAEAAALVAAGPGARLLRARVVSADGTVTAALAEGAG